MTRIQEHFDDYKLCIKQSGEPRLLLKISDKISYAHEDSDDICFGITVPAATFIKLVNVFF